MSEHRKRVHFIQDTLIGGVLFLVPVGVLVIVLAKVIDLMMLVAEPLAGFIPTDRITGVALANVFAAVAVVLMCFIAGLLARRTFLRTTVESLESKILSKVPGYVLVKGMLSGLQEDDSHRLYVVAASFDDSARVGLEIERLDDGRVVVMTPSSPNPWSGPVHIMEPDRVRRLDLPMPAYMENVERFGQGTNELIRGSGSG